MGSKPWRPDGKYMLSQNFITIIGEAYDLAGYDVL